MNTIRRFVWVVPLAVGVFELAFGLTLLILGAAGIPNVVEEIQGAPWPDVAARSDEVVLIDHLARGWGQANVAVGILIVAIAAIPFRNGERWSWFVMWLLPATLAVTAIRSLATGIESVAIIDFSEAAVLAVALLLAYENFRPGARRRSPGR